ncbi:STAS domain-containing protein [Metabacillus indicus]|uniref:STAS domain-containing protein n=1 Tax=Metabacillus indicus TaxID=246786 RepID=UPI002A063921|nr:STAS domain-containing protein [Metabacillus indicus]MDX8290337.1 STAS domain-containing protein [Metabacillus indicus]
MKAKALYQFLRGQSESMTDKWLNARTVEPVSVYSINVPDKVTADLRDQNQHFIHTLINLLENPAADRLSSWAQEIAVKRAASETPLYRTIQQFRRFRLIFLETAEAYILCHEDEFTIHDLLSFSKQVHSAFDQAIELFTRYYHQVSDARMEAHKTMIYKQTTPVIPISDEIGVLPIVGDLDMHRAAMITESAISKAEQLNLSHIVIDLSGVLVIDTMVAGQLFKMMQMLKLLGIHVTITGIRPEIAQTSIQLGIDFGDLATFGQLKHALKYLYKE